MASDMKDLKPDLARLDSHLDDLEDALGPLLGNLEGMASQLPLLDKAKLFSLTAYSIESLLFTTLKLNGTDAQAHPVYEELKRIQQYFGKIKNIESPPDEEQRKTTVNQEAMTRVLKADLADDKKLSNKLAEKIAEARARALLKSVDNGTKRLAGDSVAVSAEVSASEENVKHKKQKKDGKYKKRKEKKKKGSKD